MVQLALLPPPKRRLLEARLNTDEIERLRKVAADISALASLTDWESPDGKFVLFHILAVATWPAQAAIYPDMFLSRALAHVFAATEVKNHHSRPLSNYWMCFSGKSVLSLFKTWNDVSGILPIPPLIFLPSTATPSVDSTQGITSLRRSSRLSRPSVRRMQAEAEVHIPPHSSPSPDVDSDVTDDN
jgi:hypothetical protein